MVVRSAMSRCRRHKSEYISTNLDNEISKYDSLNNELLFVAKQRTLQKERFKMRKKYHSASGDKSSAGKFI